MQMYELPNIKPPKFKFLLQSPDFLKKNSHLITTVIFIAIISGFLAGAAAGGFFYFQVKDYLKKMNIQILNILGRNSLFLLRGLILMIYHLRAILRIMILP